MITQGSFPPRALSKRALTATRYLIGKEPKGMIIEGSFLIRALGKRALTTTRYQSNDHLRLFSYSSLK